MSDTIRPTLFTEEQVVATLGQPFMDMLNHHLESIATGSNTGEIAQRGALVQGMWSGAALVGKLDAAQAKAQCIAVAMYSADRINQLGERSTLVVHGRAEKEGGALMDTRVCPFLPDGASLSPLERAILERLDVADKPVDQGVLYSQLLTELGTGARAYDQALSHLIALELIDFAFDHADEHHAPLDESRFVLTLADAGINTLDAFWRAEAKAKSIAEAIAPALHVDESMLVITSPAFAVRFESRDAMRAYMSGGAA